MEEGAFIMTGLKKDDVVAALKVAVGQYSEMKERNKIVMDYNVDNFSKKVTKIVFSYINYVNRTVWHK